MRHALEWFVGATVTLAGVASYVVFAPADMLFDAPRAAQATGPDTRTERVARAEIARVTEAYAPARDVTWEFTPLAEQEVWALATDSSDHLIQIESGRMAYLGGETVDDATIRYVVNHEMGHQVTYRIYGTGDWHALEVMLEETFSGGPATRDVNGWELSADVIGAALSGKHGDFTDSQVAIGQAHLDMVSTLD